MPTFCTLCPRNCRVDRTEKTGYCGMGLQPRIARAALHFWEEPCISGTKGSGTVFFSGCTLRCAYCQNYPISHQGQGKDVTVPRLAEIFKMLYEQGAHNINLVTGTPFIPAILDALAIYRPPIPIVWNSGGYEKAETLKLLEGAIDIYLPDFKHVSPRLSGLCAGAPDYFDIASQAILEMCRQTGSPQYNEEGMMQRGTLIRHLILPGCTMDSCKVLSWIAENLPKGTPVSLMRQYSPEPWCTIKGLDRRITDQEYERVLSHYQALDLSGYTQEKESADTAYTPPFDLTGV
ncbi:MAG: radical SAM protein [Clostridiales bacterium]|nr:radical SAM protein [Clostridiales bacterium]